MLAAPACRRLAVCRAVGDCRPMPRAAPVPKEQLLKPPADATHYVVVSEAGKHGDQWRWTHAGRVASPIAIRSRCAAGSPRSTRSRRSDADGMPTQ